MFWIQIISFEKLKLKLLVVYDLNSYMKLNISLRCSIRILQFPPAQILIALKNITYHKL